MNDFESVDFFADESLTEDPYPYFEQLRAVCPVLPLPHLGVVAVTGYEESTEVYRDKETPNPRLQTWLAEWDHWHCEAEDYVVCGDTVAVLTRYRGRGKGSGVEVDVEGAHVWKLRADGMAVRLEVFADRERALAAASGMAADLVEDAVACFGVMPRPGLQEPSGPGVPGRRTAPAPR